MKRFVLQFAAAFAVSTLAWSAPAVACSVCFGDKDSALTQGAASGVLFMVILTYVMLCGMVGIAGFWAYRARRLRLASSTPVDVAAAPREGGHERASDA